LSNTLLIECLPPDASIDAQGGEVARVMTKMEAGTANRWQFAWGFFRSFGMIREQIGKIRQKADPNGSDYNPACKELYDGLMTKAGLTTNAKATAFDQVAVSESELQMSNSFLETSTLCSGCYRDTSRDGEGFFNIFIFAVMYYCYTGMLCGIGMIGPNPLVACCGLLWPFR